jgi:predicted Zn-dependent protease
MEDNMRKFIEEIIKRAGLDGMPADFLDEYAEKLAEEAQKRIGVESMALLTPEQTEELGKLMEQSHNDPKPINDYLVSRIEHYQEKMAAVLKQFGDEVIESAKKVNNK